MDVPFDVVYNPKDVSNDLRSEVSNFSLSNLLNIMLFYYCFPAYKGEYITQQFVNISKR